jgi:hypothetical protein
VSVIGNLLSVVPKQAQETVAAIVRTISPHPVSPRHDPATKADERCGDQPRREPPPYGHGRAPAKGWKRNLALLLGWAKMVNAVTPTR